MAVLAATLTSSVVFFPVTLLYGVSRFLFSALAAGRRAGALRLLFRRDDGRSALLRAVPERHPARRRGRPRHADSGVRTPGAGTFADRFNLAFAAKFESLAGLVRKPRASVASTSGIGDCGDRRPVLCQPDPVSVPWRGLLPAHRRRPVRHERQVALRQPNRGVIGRRAEGRSHRPAHRRSSRSGSDRVEHRRPAGFLVDLHQQRRSSHVHGPGGAQGGPPDRQLRVHGAGARRAAAGTAPSERVLSVRRHGRRRAQSGPARTDRRPVERIQHRRGVQGRDRRGGVDSKAAAASAMSSSRRTSTIRRSVSTSIASAPPTWASTSARWSTT